MSEQNPLLKDTMRVRWNRWLCKQFGCIKTGPYYGMAQSHCRRCGHENWGNASPEKWNLPWGEYELSEKHLTTAGLAELKKDEAKYE